MDKPDPSPSGASAANAPRLDAHAMALLKRVTDYLESANEIIADDHPEDECDAEEAVALVAEARIFLAESAAAPRQPEGGQAAPKGTGGLWRKSGIAGGKYLVQRRDGSVPEWPYFVIGAKDPAAAAGLRAYATEAERLGFDPKYVADVRKMVVEFEDHCANEGAGDPDARPHRKDDPATIAKMTGGKGA